MNMRSKSNTQRAFVRVANLVKEVEDQIRIKELKISQEVSKLELKLINLTPKHNDLNYKELPQELKIELKNLKSQQKNQTQRNYGQWSRVCMIET